tara:strand:+ start:3543 stop:4937 length:1395 start_codon:yes stop_codon:yes gene_type:complete
MVGEVSPDGNFVWDGKEWLPRVKEAPIEDVPTEGRNAVFEMADQKLAGDVGWEPASEKTEDGSKAKLVAMSVVGLLIVSALGWIMYAFVIDPMLFPDPYSKSKFVSVVGDQPTLDEVISGGDGPWSCHVEMKIEEEGMVLRTNFDMYTSKDSAMKYSKMSAGLLGSYSTEVWIDENQIAWKIDGDTNAKNKVAISNLDSSPADEILSDSSSPVDLCFLHHAIVESMDENPSQKFTSDKERFPDEDGVRAVKVETKMEIDDEEGDMNIAVYFDGDDNLLGTRISNSSLDCLITFESKSFSQPKWVSSADSENPMLLSVDDNNIWDAQHTALVNTQFNATYLMEGAKVVIYEADWDDGGNSSNTIIYEVDIEDAMGEGGALIQPTNWNGEAVNCTLRYIDTDSDNEISSGDGVTVHCEESVLSGFQLGLANENGVAETANLEMPWISQIFTIIALLGAAMFVSKRE